MYSDEWDWEKIIDKKDRNIDNLKKNVSDLYEAIKYTEKSINESYSVLKNKLPENIYFITAQELEDMFPNLSAEEREYEIVLQHKAVFVMCIGGALQSGKPHKMREPDYDDWSMNGDMLFYHEPLDCVIEIGSAAIRADAEKMEYQLEACGALDRKNLDFHKMIFNNILPLSVGGGVGQSRLCMFLLEKVHIGEVQVSVWPERIIKECAYRRIFLL